MRKIIFGIGFLTLCVQATQANATARDSLRNVFIRDYHDYFYIWPVLKQRSLEFDITERSNRTQTLNYRPNNSFLAGIGLHLFEVSVELTAAIPLNEKSIQRFGESDSRDVQANILSKMWGLDLFSQRYSGLYLSDSRKPVLPNQPFPQRPDIQVSNVGGNGIYIFNKHKFSLRSSYNYSEHQVRSIGSWVMTGTISNFKMNAAATVLTSEFENKVGVESSFRQLHYTTISMAPGYSQNFIYKDFFVNTTLSIGPAHHWIYHQRKDGSDHYDIAVNTFADVRVGLGYNSDKVFGGISFVRQSRSVRFEQVQFTNSNSLFKVVLGYRFKETGFLKKRLLDLIPIR